MDERRLQFIEGKSSKFWSATHDGTSVTVVFGRIGTNGQTQEKVFSSEAEAKKAFDKLVAEKVKKGYADSDGRAALGGRPAASHTTQSHPRAGSDESAQLEAPGAVAARDPGSGTASETPTRIRLSQADRIAGLIEPVPFTPCGPAQPFERAQCIARLAALAPADSLTIPWGRLRLTPCISVEEAWFWLRIGRKIAPLGELLEAAKEVPPAPPEHDPDCEYVHGPLLAAAYVALGPAGFCDVLFANGIPDRDADSVVAEIVPHLDGVARDELRDALMARAARHPHPWATWLLAILGLDAQSVAELLARQSPPPRGNARLYTPASRGLGDLRSTFGLRDPVAILAAIKRMGAAPVRGSDARALLAAVGFDGCEIIMHAILNASSKSEAESLVAALALAEGPANVLPMFTVSLESKVPGAARRWLDCNAGFAVPGLLPLVATQDKRADAAAEYLRSLAQSREAGLFEGSQRGLPDDIQRVLRLEVSGNAVPKPTVASDAELPEWARRCFGDPVVLPAVAVELSHGELNPPVVITGCGDDAVEPTLRLPPHVPCGDPAPFDFEACLARVLGIHVRYSRWTHPYDTYDWTAIHLQPPMTRQEGHFWVEAKLLARDRVEPEQLEKWFRMRDYDAPLKPERAETNPPLIAAWAAGGREFLGRLAEHSHRPEAFAAAVVAEIVPTLPQGERDELRDHLLFVPSPSKAGLILAHHLGAGREALRAALARLGPLQRDYDDGSTIRVLAWYGDPELIAREASRLGLSVRDETTARAWLRATGVHGLERIGAAAVESDGDERAALVRLLASIRAPAVAPFMLSLRQTNARELARQWLDANVAHTIHGLLPLVGTKTKLARPATEHLRDLCRRGYRELILAQSAGRTDVAKLVLDPRAGIAPARAVDRSLAARLPPIVVMTPHGPRALGPERTTMILAQLRSSTLGAPTPPLRLMRENVDEPSRDAFVLALLQSWLSDGAPSSERWMLEATGHLGGDAAAIALTKLVRSWPGESQHQRAVLGLECLRAIGSDTALLLIHGLSQKASFKGLRERAAECIEGIAADRGLSPERLADRIIPSAGLNERGSRTFDFGPRRFEFRLGDDLKPKVTDEAGRLLPNLPKPNAKDDEQLADDAVTAWKLCKKQVAEVLKTQGIRLEHAMVTSRRWSRAEFDRFIVRHPLMVHLSRRLVWGVYDSEGALLSTFRVGDDRTLTTVADETYYFPDGTPWVGVAHPLHLGSGLCGAWSTLLADYDVLQPFPQLGRPTCAPTAAELGERVIRRFKADRLVAKQLVFGLEAMGWVREAPQDGGRFGAHHKSFGSVTAWVSYLDGCWVGSKADDWPTQHIDGVGFLANTAHDNGGFCGWDDGPQALPLAEVDAVIVSEVLYDLSRLVRKCAAGQP